MDGCLQSLIEKSSELPDEIVIVDGEGGKIQDIVLKWQEKFGSIMLIPTKNINLAVSRNKGLSACSGGIIALTDDDVMVDADWIKRIKYLHEAHPESGVIGGKIKSAGGKFIDRISEAVIFPFGEKAGYVRTVAGANASYKREVINRVGEYDESLFRGEDVDYNWRAIKLGYRIYYDPGLIVYHSHRHAWKDLFYQIFMYGQAYYLVRKKWKDMYCVYPHKIKNLKDALKFAYFFIGILYEPLLMSIKMKRFADKVLSYPIIVANNLCWKFGMIKQMLVHGRKAASVLDMEENAGNG